jgi:glycosyltransferase involved in cell wall biosynthesis
MRRTVLYLVSTLARCGPINVLREIVRHLDPERYRAVIATLSPEKKDSCIGEIQGAGVLLRQLHFPSYGVVVGKSKDVGQLIQEVDASIIHSHGIRADILLARSNPQCATVSTLHCDLVRDYQLAYGFVMGRLMAATEYAALRGFDSVAAVSESVASAALRASVISDVIPNGIDVTTCRPPTSICEKNQIRQRYAWPESATVVLHTGALIERKNPIDIIRAFRRSRLSEYALLVFAGDGPLRPKCEQAAEGSPNVVFMGPRGDIPELLMAADVLVSNSRAEGLPMALLEGCAAGITILATDIPPHQDIQRLFSAQVTLLPKDDIRSFANALDQLALPREKLCFTPGPAALDSISSRAMSTSYQRLYDRLISAHPPESSRQRQLRSRTTS